LIATPSSKPAAEAARACGARVTASPDGIAGMSAVVLAVKPGLWRQALAPWLPALVPDAVVLSVMAGVAGADIAAAVAARPVARLMPTTAVAQGQGVAALWSDGPAAEAAARTLFGALADLVPLADETLFHAATAVSRWSRPWQRQARPRGWSRMQQSGWRGVPCARPPPARRLVPRWPS
jgi:pyrroline-5-carboxylate reductase